jgi:energy-converting hydrogenase Eha subunit C
MVLGAIPDILMMEEAKEVAIHLGYPLYLLPLLGVAIISGAITILIPGSGRLKEWAYAGLSINLISAIYSIIQVDSFGPNVLIPSIGIVFLAVSYIFWVKTKQIKAIAN